MWLLIAFIAVPLIEIALFIQVGGFIGTWPTLGIVFITAVVGSWLVRNQGQRELGKLRQSFSTLQDPSEPLAHGAMILFAGALLLTPGFFTDIVGLSLLIPTVRKAAFLWAKSKIKMQGFAMGQPPRPDDNVVNGDFTDVTPNKKPTHELSEWTRH